MNADAPRGSQGRRMMEDKLRLYLWWKGKLSERKAEGKGPIALPQGKSKDDDVSEALKRKDREKQERAANRRRVRGGAPAAATTGRDAKPAAGGAMGEGEIKKEADDIAALYALSFTFAEGGSTSHMRSACQPRASTMLRPH